MGFYIRTSSKHVLRGLHYQLEPYAQAKLVRCLRGAIFDVVVDIRQGSPSYGKWMGYELSEDNHRMFFVPAGRRPYCEKIVYTLGTTSYCEKIVPDRSAPVTMTPEYCIQLPCSEWSRFAHLS